MIFVTVGTQEPFDRLIRAVDDWCSRGGDREAFGQISAHGSYRPRHFEAEASIEPERFRELATSCELMVGHAGMGTIIVALSHCTPLLVVPRKASLGEHRNEHQLATARRFADRETISVEYDETKLPDRIDAIRAAARSDGSQTLPSFASADLLERVTRFIHGRG